MNYSQSQIKHYMDDKIHQMEEGLDNLTVSGALDAIRRADLLIVAGTSLTVYPAAAFLDEYPGNRLVLINKTATPRDDIANLALHEKLGEVFQNL